MKNLIMPVCVLLTFACTVLPQYLMGQSAGTIQDPVKAETKTPSPARAIVSQKAETIIADTLLPSKATKNALTNTATAKLSAVTAVKASKVTVAGGNKVPEDKPDNQKIKEGEKVMTHEEIEKMMAERELVMKELLHKPAPAFTATDLNGNTYELDELKGKVVVLNFWFTGCKPCIMEIPHLNNLVEKYGSKDVVFLAFALDDEPSLQKFLSNNTFKYNVIPAANKIAEDTYKVNSYPTSIVIDKKGIVQHYLIGYSEDVEEKLIAFIEKSLNL